jgi:uncharacterized protein
MNAPFRKATRFGLYFILAWTWSILAGPVLAQAPMILPVHPALLVIETAQGHADFTVEIADDAEKRSRGLMFRERMAEMHGMLFVFEESQPVGFWMQNTPLPLDLVFISDTGHVRAVLGGEPFSTALISPGVPVRFVLELNAGVAQKKGVAIGDRIRHPVIDAVAGDG